MFAKGTDILALGYRLLEKWFEIQCVRECVSEYSGCCTGAACGVESTALKVPADIIMSSVAVPFLSFQMTLGEYCYVE